MNSKTSKASRRVHFRTSRDRKVFAPVRLRNELKRDEMPHLGPGCYDNHQFDTIVYNLQKRPESKKGYALSARTAARFPPNKMMETPWPQQYQQDSNWSRLPPPGRAPFGSTAPRFTSHTDDCSPGPGTYSWDGVTNRKVSWPMCFGRPDWSRLPRLEQGASRVKLPSYREFVKYRSRLVYLSLYY
ncbi:si:ch211-66i15.4 isoform X1 [Cyprinodon tularosa]|uniref:si:ch211-66i15.4 isoform X1 n=1 Tax=Cyprinodon tularosa TaxID=77115 RepID=UPI0018E23849|nr:si:ch211-66i15.4 isoform X1 [Cyprinodon tularosa]